MKKHFLLLIATTYTSILAGCEPSIDSENLPSNEKKDQSTTPAEKTKCTNLNAEACAATTGCQMASGSKLNLTGSCEEPSAIAGCTSMDCGDEEQVAAQDQSGNRWIFATACYPDGWKELTQKELPEGSDSWKQCSSASQP